MARFIGPTWGPTWGPQDPGGPHVGQVNLAIWVNRELVSNKMSYPEIFESLKLMKLGVKFSGFF